MILVVLWKDVATGGACRHRPGLYRLLLHHHVVCWETVRRQLYPKPNAWMAAIAATCWFATEITGEIYNLGLGNISEIFFRLVWVFYGTNVHPVGAQRLSLGGRKNS